jgi:hypothetical protein
MFKLMVAFISGTLLEWKRFQGISRSCFSTTFVIPSEVEESHAVNQKTMRDVSVRAGLAYSLDMTKSSAR